MPSIALRHRASVKVIFLNRYCSLFFNHFYCFIQLTVLHHANDVKPLGTSDGHVNHVASIGRCLGVLHYGTVNARYLYGIFATFGKAQVHTFNEGVGIYGEVGSFNPINTIGGARYLYNVGHGFGVFVLDV